MTEQVSAISDHGYQSDLWYRIRKQCVQLAGTQALLDYIIEYLKTSVMPPILDEQRVWEIMQPAMEDRDAIDMMAHQILDPDGEPPITRRERHVKMVESWLKPS